MVSVCRSLFVTKMDPKMLQAGKLSSLEEGSLKYELMNEDYARNRTKKGNKCNKFMQFMKVILYLELIIFVGWIGCVLISGYYGSARSYQVDGPRVISESETESSAFPASPHSTDLPRIEETTELPGVDAELSTESTVDGLTHDHEKSEGTAVNLKFTDPKFFSEWLEVMQKTRSAVEKISSHSRNTGSSGENADDSSDETLKEETSSSEFGRDVSKIYEPSMPISIPDYGEDMSNFESPEDYFMKYSKSYLGDFEDSIASRWRREIGEQAKQDSSSSSSEEKKNPMPKTKRSTDSSSESSSSSSSESDEKSKKSKNDCYDIRDEDGNKIKDALEIISYIKSNGLPWLLDPTMMDCNGSRPEVTMNDCGKLILRCPKDDDDDDDDTNEDDDQVKKVRREADTEDKNQEDMCKNMTIQTTSNIEALTTSMVTGEKTDSGQEFVHMQFSKKLMSLAFRMVLSKLNHHTTWTDDQMRDNIIALRQNTSRFILPEHQKYLIESQAITQEMVNGLRNIVDMMSVSSEKCLGDGVTLEELRHTFTALEMLFNRETCVMSERMMEAKEDALIAEILPGDYTNANVIIARDQFKILFKTLMEMIAMQERSDPAVLPTGPVNITDEQWTNYMVLIKNELIKDAKETSFEKLLKNSAFPTDYHKKQLHDLMEFNLREKMQCSTFNMFNLLGTLIELDKSSKRTRRAVFTATPKPIIKECTITEDDTQFMEERRARIEEWKKAQKEQNNHYPLPLLAKLDEEIKSDNPSEINRCHFSDCFAGGLAIANFMSSGATAQMRKETYSLLRDVILQAREFVNEDLEEFAGEPCKMMKMDTTVTDCPTAMADNMTQEKLFVKMILVARYLNLTYTGVSAVAEGEEPKPVYGTFVHEGEETENSRKWRHIFNRYTQLYYKMHKSDELPEDRKCLIQLSESSTKDEAAGATEEKKVAKRWSEKRKRRSEECMKTEDDNQFMAERQARIEEWKKAQTEHNTKYPLPLLEKLEEEINSENPSKINHCPFSDCISHGVALANFISDGTSAEIRRETYRLLRDVVLESRDIVDQTRETFAGDTCNMMQMDTTKTECPPAMPAGITLEIFFNHTIAFGSRLNMTYTGTNNVPGKFVYDGEEPEQSRKWRHILDRFVELYYKIQKPDELPETRRCLFTESNAKDQTADATEEKKVAKRWSEIRKRRSEECMKTVDDNQFMEERQARIEEWKKAQTEQNTKYPLPLLEKLEEEINSENPSEINRCPFSECISHGVALANFLSDGTSADLRRETYSLLRDVVLEAREFVDENREMFAGDTCKMMQMDTTKTECPPAMAADASLEMFFNNTVALGSRLNMTYTGMNNAPGKFVYDGEETEQSRKWRHILDRFVELYYKMHKPDELPETRKCLFAESNAKDETADATEEKKVSKRWSEIRKRRSEECMKTEDDNQFMAERQARDEEWKKAQTEQNTQYPLPFLAKLEEEINSENPSEINGCQFSLCFAHIMSFANFISAGMSADIRKETYRLLRDFVLEVREFVNEDLEELQGEPCKMMEMDTTRTECPSQIAPNVTLEQIFGRIIELGHDNNFTYSGIKNEGEGDEPKSVYGKFTHEGEETEKSRKWRHILDRYVELYYKIHKPDELPETRRCLFTESNAKGETADATEEKKVAKRWSEIRKRRSEECMKTEDDNQFMEERQARIEESKRAQTEQNTHYPLPFLAKLEEEINSENPSEINRCPFSDCILNGVAIANFISDGKSAEIRKETYRLLRDVVLETREFVDEDREMFAGDTCKMIQMDTTKTDCPSPMAANATLGKFFNTMIVFGRSLNMTYTGINNVPADEDPKPEYGRFVYDGEETEKSRKWRHIFDRFTDLYYKIDKPDELPEIRRCLFTESNAKDQTADVMEEKKVAKRWSEIRKRRSEECLKTEDDDQFMEERQARVEESKKAQEEQNTHYPLPLLAKLDEEINSENTSEINSCPFSDCILHALDIVNFMSAGASAEIRKEIYKLLRDAVLEAREYVNEDLEDFAGDTCKMMQMDTTITECPSSVRKAHATPDKLFYSMIEFGNSMNMTYTGMKEVAEDEKPKLVFGKFVYEGEETEKSRKWRHIFNRFGELYYKIHIPDELPENRRCLFAFNDGTKETKVA